MIKLDTYLLFLQAEFDSSGWERVIEKDIPQQMNGSDCGMFTCKNAEYLSRRAKITFDQAVSVLSIPWSRNVLFWKIWSIEKISNRMERWPDKILTEWVDKRINVWPDGRMAGLTDGLTDDRIKWIYSPTPNLSSSDRTKFFCSEHALLPAANGVRDREGWPAQTLTFFPSNYLWDKLCTI